VLDPVEVEDEVDRLLGPRLRREGLVEVPAEVGVAGSAGAAVDVDHSVVAAVAVDEQDAAGAAEDVLRRGVAAVEGEAIADVEAARVVRGDEGPHEAILRHASAIVEDADAGLVGLHDIAGSDALQQAIRERSGYRKFNRPFWRVWRVGRGHASAALGTDRAQIGGSCVGFRHRGATQRLSA
jgi:hypothetical protein